MELLGSYIRSQECRYTWRTLARIFYSHHNFEKNKQSFKVKKRGKNCLKKYGTQLLLAPPATTPRICSHGNREATAGVKSGDASSSSHPFLSLSLSHTQLLLNKKPNAIFSSTQLYEDAKERHRETVWLNVYFYHFAQRDFSARHRLLFFNGVELFLHRNIDV